MALLHRHHRALAAACLGFLPLNVPRAKVFLGDVGSHAIGYGAAALALLAAQAPGVAGVHPRILGVTSDRRFPSHEFVAIDGAHRHVLHVGAVQHGEPELRTRRPARPYALGPMSILVNKDTRLVVQGMTGREGLFHTQQMLAYAGKGRFVVQQLNLNVA